MTLSALRQGLDILLRYDPEAVCNATHDELFCGGPDPAELQDYDREKLEELGFRWSEDSWAVFT